VRVEFRDRTEETTRAIGSLVIELHADGAEPGDRRWRYDLDSLAAHDRHYDQVTATYRFALAPDWPTDLRSAALVLKVYFYGVDGAVLSAEARLSPGLKSSLASKKVNAADL
ncbi:MAG: hypothetical protein SGJ11_13010, partial [Phycisphaerae bacterium]|nr:hypothetical protein [Phycisphaerae bacterium]